MLGNSGSSEKSQHSLTVEPIRNRNYCHQGNTKYFVWEIFTRMIRGITQTLSWVKNTTPITVTSYILGQQHLVLIFGLATGLFTIITYGRLTFQTNLKNNSQFSCWSRIEPIFYQAKMVLRWFISQKKEWNKKM